MSATVLWTASLKSSILEGSAEEVAQVSSQNERRRILSDERLTCVVVADARGARSRAPVHRSPGRLVAHGERSDHQILNVRLETKEAERAISNHSSRGIFRQTERLTSFVVEKNTVALAYRSGTAPSPSR